MHIQQIHYAGQFYVIISLCLSICLFLLCFNVFRNFVCAIFVPICVTSLDELFAFFLVARHCVSYGFIVFQCILHFAQLT